MGSTRCALAWTGGIEKGTLLSHALIARFNNVLLRFLGGRRLSRLHAWSHRRTKGRFLPHWFGLPVLILEVNGRKTNRLRRVPIVYILHESKPVVVPANGGVPRLPAWWLNLLAADVATIHYDGKSAVVQPRVLVGSEDLVVRESFMRRYPQLSSYTELAGRSLLLVQLEPVSATRRAPPATEGHG